MQDWIASAPPEQVYFYKEHNDFPEFMPRTFEWFSGGSVPYYAGALAALGIRRGDRVAVHEHWDFTMVNLFWALARIGAVFVPLNTRLTDAELHDQIRAAGCRFVLAARESLAIPGHTYLSLDPHNPRFPTLTPPHLLPRTAGDPYRTATLDLNAVAAVVFTSGTSGTPKASQLTFGNFAASAAASAERLGVRPDDRWLLCLPLYHVGGLSLVIRCAIQRTPFVLLDSGYTLDKIRQVLDTEPITHVSLVPTQLYRLLQSGFKPSPYLRLILLGGAAASPELLALAAEGGLPVATTYGLTEACSQVATQMPDGVRRKPGSVGKPLSGTTVRVTDEHGQDQPPSQYGDIIVSGPTVMKGYIGQPETGGSFRTGDIGYLDAEGDLWLVQRRSDLIVSGGENVYPAEVEKVLRTHPAVADVCVVGIADAEWGQRVAAAVVLHPGLSLDADALIGFARTQLGGYKVPRKVLFLDALPVTGSGKVQRSRVRTLLENR
ncbi:MAG: o-succinylbenzoate--CoA ligase [bacterium]|nr:o-succinylbenzoate--CoA ligase [bacterium]